MMARFRSTLLATTALMPLGVLAAAANPLGSQVVGGSANVSGQGTSTVTVTQSTEKAIINWQTFNIGTGETTQFVQPNSSSVTLNRVTGNLGASVLDGTLTANGRVFIVNPDGILFGANSRVNVGGFLAATSDIKNQDFMAGRYQFNIPGRAFASIVNLGTITANNGGFAALVAPGVRNTGTITANLGTVGLGAGNSFSLDFYGDRLITLGINDSIAARVIDVATGQPLDALVKNEGKLKANGGRVELTAAAARQVVDSVINNTGIIEANSIGTHNGMIVLGAATSATKPAGAPTQTIKLSGTLSAAGKGKNTKGGTIVVSGENIQVSSATIDASGQEGDGKVLIGGDVGGGNGNSAVANNPMAALEAFKVSNASTVSVDPNTTIDASAKTSGNGGKVVVWSDQSTTFYGTILARGGSASGNGGFVETSGHQSLTFNGLVNAGAPNGAKGMLLLDPQDATIQTAAGGSVVTVSSIEAALANGDVTVTTGSTGTDRGNILVAANISWANANALTLSAYKDIIVNANITNTGGAAVNLRADNTGAGVGTVTFGSGVQISTSGQVSIFYNPSVNPAGSMVNSTSYVSPVENFAGNVTGGGTLTAYMLVNTIYDLQNIRNNTTGSYALGKDIYASATVTWNGGSGFVPIGTSTVPFIGVLDGQSHAIDQLFINSLAASVGLFGYLGAAGIVRNLALTNASISGIGGLGEYDQDQHRFVVKVGGIAGTNFGTILQTSVTAPALKVVAASPIGISTGGSGVQSIYISGSLAFLSISNLGLRIVDISDPKHPHIVATFAGVTNSYNAVVVGRYAYVADNVLGLVIIDISNPVSPTLVSTSPIAGGTTHVAVSGNFAYLTDFNSGAIRIFDVTSPTTPTLVSSYLTAGNPAIPRQQRGITGAPYSVSVIGQYMYIADFSSAVEIVNVSNPRLPVHVGSYFTNISAQRIQAGVPNTPVDFAVAGNNLYVADQVSGLYILNITNPTAPVLVGSYEPGGLAGSTYYGIQVVGNYAYVADFAGRLTKIDVSSPMSPTLVGMSVTSDRANAVAVAGNYGFLATSTGIQIVDLNSPSAAISGGFESVVGTIAGKNAGTISRSYGNEVVAGYQQTGGLVGFNSGNIFDSYASGAVTGSANYFNLGAPTSQSGGLVGANIGTIERSYATGSISGLAVVAGGLVGNNSGLISQSFATGNPTGLGFASSMTGGLVGTNSLAGTITQSYATGNVNNSFLGGGLVASNAGTITQSYATGTVASYDDSNFNSAGGLVGYNQGTGTISGSFATGAVSGGYYTGGLVGNNVGSITQSYATGSIHPLSTRPGSAAGGLVGVNTYSGTIDQSFATGAVNADPVNGAATILGGLVGENDGAVSRSYATGAVTEIYGVAQYVGGLVGYNAGGTVDQSYATGAVSGQRLTGGLIGSNNSGAVTNSYWDVVSTGQVGSDGGSPSPPAGLKGVLPFGFDSVFWVNGASTSSGYPTLSWQLTPPITLQPPGSLPAGFSPNVWAITSTINSNYPYLRWQVANSSSPTVLTPTPPLIEIDVAAISATKIYGQLDPVFTYQITSGTLNSGDLFTGSLTRVAGNNVGTYTINQGSLSLPATYSLVFTTAVLTITAAPLTITADNKSRGFGQPNPVLTASFSGLVNGDNSSVVTGVTVSTLANVHSLGGNYDIVASGPQTTSNYTITYTKGTLTVGQPPLQSVLYYDPRNLAGLTFTGSNNAALGIPATANHPDVSGFPGLSNSDSPQDLLRSAMSYLNASAAVYNLASINKFSSPPQTWDSFARTVMGLSDTQIEYFKSTGFSAALYNINGKIVVAFAGTDPNFVGRYIDFANDAFNDLLNFAGLSSPQYAFAVQFAQAVAQSYGADNVTLTGHSLGGGLAAYAGSTLGIHAVTFNPAGIHPASSSPYVLNFEIGNNFAQAGGTTTGQTIIFDPSLLTPKVAPITSPNSTPPVATPSGLQLHGLEKFVAIANNSNLIYTGTQTSSLNTVFNVGQQNVAASQF
jgi:filamentous hemagglutinin family protein